MNKRLFLAFTALSLAGLCFCQMEKPADDIVLEILSLQKAAWNRGDIEGFMAYYWRSDDLTFQSANTRTLGWSAVLARYKRNYAAGNMGRLDFTDLDVRVLSPDSAYVLGRFKLDLEADHREGVFTLILRRTEDGWRIIHDHTSSE